MKAMFAHQNFNVLDLEKSLQFYKEALGLEEVRRKEGEGYTLVYIGETQTAFTLELTYLHDRTQPYDLGEEEFHLAFMVDDYEEAHALHEKMDCICFENKEMGIYFIQDPDGYWLEIIPKR